VMHVTLTMILGTLIELIAHFLADWDLIRSNYKIGLTIGKKT
jgi:hypothetical protein